MDARLRSLLHAGLPPIIFSEMRRRFGPIRWHGSFSDWAGALACCTGYGDGIILDRVEAAVRDVLAGNAAYERDSVRHFDAEQSWPLLAAAGLAHARNGHLRVLDIGGSLGSAWLQHRQWLTALHADWRIVEQPAFVECGRALFPQGVPSFFTAMDAASADGAPSLAFLGAVLPYIDDPAALLRQLVALRPEVIFIDRTSVHDAAHDRIAIQSVAASIYRAAYPCWIFARQTIPRLLEANYTLWATTPCPGQSAGPDFTGWIFVRRGAA